MTDMDAAARLGADPSGADPSGAAAASPGAGRAYEAGHHRGHGEASPSSAQAAAAKAAYEDVQASTGGESKTPFPPAADPVESPPERPGDGSAQGPGRGTDATTQTQPDAAAEEEAGPPDSAAQEQPPGEAFPRGEAPVTGGEGGSDAQLAAERLADLQRLQAEYVNYKRRVDRDRAVESERAIAGMVEALLPVLDEIQLARQHGELGAGPFAKIAEKLETTLGRYGVQRYGEPGETFDPTVHEAVMHTHAELAPGTTETTVVQVLQPGYRMGDRVLRAALVAVADPA